MTHHVVEEAYVMHYFNGVLVDVWEEAHDFIDEVIERDGSDESIGSIIVEDTGDVVRGRPVWNIVVYIREA